MSHSVKFKTFGCKLNQAETASLVKTFADAGYEVREGSEPADVAVLNTCTVTGRSSAKARQAIRQMLRENPETTVVVLGCYSQVAAEELAELEGVDYILGSQDKFFLMDHFPGPGKLDQPRVLVSPMEQLDLAISQVGDYRKQTRAFLKIQDGCEHGCAYCIVPITRGPCRSVPEQEIIEQARKLLQLGYREIVLTGVHVGDYGKERDGRTHLPVLLNQMLTALPGLGRLRLSSLNSEDITDELLKLFINEPRLARHFHIPLQAGQDDVLKAMKRDYSTAKFRETVDQVIQTLGPVGLGSDVIVGFPGESDEQFDETVAFVESIPFTYLHVFPYSIRPGTVAANMSGHVQATVKNERAKRLRLVAQRKKEAYIQSFIGKSIPVLFEGRNQAGRISGLTSEYVRVSVPYDAALDNQIVNVSVAKAVKDVLWGDVVK